MPQPPSTNAIDRSRSPHESGPRVAAARGWPGLAVFVALVVAIAVCRWPIVDSPPYFEYAMGFFMEAEFLAETAFDYHALRYEAPVGNQGGPYVYMTSVLPTLLALLMRIAPSTESTFVVAHLATFLCAAFALWLVLAMIAPHAGRWPALWAVAALATTPLFSTQFDMLGTDLPTATAILLTAWCVAGRRWYWASAAATVSFFMKPTGALATLALLCTLGALLLFDRRDARRRRRYAGALLLALTALALQLSVYTWGGVHERLSTSRGPSNFLVGARLVCPDLSLLGLAIAVGYGWLALRGRCPTGESPRARRTSRDPARALDSPPPPAPPAPPAPREGPTAAEHGSRWDAMVQFAARYPEVVLSAAVLAGLALAIQYYGYVSPHYYALGAPLLFVVMGPLLGLAARARSRATCTALAALVLFNLANGEGRFFPALDEVSQWSRGGDRSRAYLDDHRSNIAAMTRLAAVAGSTPIVTGPPYSYFLALPRLGYVAEPLAGYTTKPLAVRTFRDVRELLDDPPEELIFIHVSNIHYAYARVSIPPPEPDDEIIYRDALASPLVIYRKRLADIAPTPDERVAWLLEHLWYDETLDERPSISLVDRAGLLSAYGRHDLAARLIERGLVDRPHDARLHLRLAQLLMREGHVTAAEEHLDAALATTPDEQAPNKARIYHEVARLRIAQQQRFAAVEALERALALDPSLAVAHNDLGAIRLELSQWGEAARHFQAALAADPNLADAHYNLGLLRMAELRPGEAAEHFEATLRLRHDYPQAREQLEAARRALDSPRDME